MSAARAPTQSAPGVVVGAALALRAALAAGGVLVGVELLAQPTPVRPVRLVVPYPPGGGTDILGRVLSGSLSERLGQQVVVDNRAGAGTVVGTEIVARAPADGYTLLMNTTAIVINQALLRRAPYDVLQDFAPVMHVAIVHNVLVTPPALPARTLRELIDLARSRTGGLAFGSSGTGTVGHLAGELFAGAIGVRMTHVPYRGGGPLMTELIGGQIQLTFASLPSSVGFIRAGRVHALAVASPRRALAMPELPTMSESGLPGFEATNWLALFAPARTSPAIVERWHALMRLVLAEPEIQRQLAVNSFEPVGSTPAELAALLRAELAKWARVIKEAGARAD